MDRCHLLRDSQKLFLKHRKWPWTGRKCNKSYRTSLNSLNKLGAPSRSTERVELLLLKPVLVSTACLETQEKLQEVPLLKRIRSPEPQELGESTTSMKAMKLMKTATQENRSTFKDLSTRLSYCGDDPDSGRASLRINTPSCSRSTRPSAPGIAPVKPGRLCIKISSIIQESLLSLPNSGGISFNRDPSVSTGSWTGISTTPSQMRSQKELEWLKLALMANRLERECLAIVRSRPQGQD